VHRVLRKMELHGFQPYWIDVSLYLFHGGRVTGQIAWVLALLVYFWPSVALSENWTRISGQEVVVAAARIDNVNHASPIAD
jgi:hypothetical protein